VVYFVKSLESVRCLLARVAPVLPPTLIVRDGA